MKTATCLFVLLAWAPAALADAFRCGVYTVRDGMPSAELREKCGTPDLIRTREEPIHTRLENGSVIQVGTTMTDFWYYDRGPTEYVVRVIVRDSIAEEVELLTVRNVSEVPDD